MSEKKKKRWKTAVIVICLLLVLAGVAAVLWLAWTMPVEEAQALVEEIKVFAVERVVPIGTAVLAAVAVILAMLSPAVSKVKDSADRFNATSDSISAEQTESVKTREAVEAYKAEQDAQLTAALAQLKAEQDERLDAMQARVDECCARLDAASDRLDENNRVARQTREMVRVACGNSRELVEAGQARRIQLIARGDIEPEVEIDE